jgi:alkanesulfonate monooxygenase SsuD/methylene tetrahydromethanopterin reductase-like flavin-dependent oxidoreductase (luciferase family)
MKLIYFQQVPYRHLPDDFEHRYEPVVSTPYHDLVDSSLVAKTFKDSLDEIMHAAREGFDAVAVTEHGQSSYDMVPNPDILQAAIAYATESEGLKVGIYPLGRSLGKSREPLRVAEELAMIDCISNGRLIAGFPVGLPYDASVNNGVAPAEQRLRFDENLALVLKAWTSREIFAWNGRFHQHASVNLWPRPIQDAPHPPVWITGTGNPKSMETVLRGGYGFNSFGTFGSAAGRAIFGKLWETADKLGLERNPNRAGMTQCVVVADTDAEAERLYARHVEYYYRKTFGVSSMDRLMIPGGIEYMGLQAMMRGAAPPDMASRMKTVTFAELVEKGCVIAGSPATVRERISALTKELGIGNLLPMLQLGSMPHELTLQNITLFMREVAPYLRESSTANAMEHSWWPKSLQQQVGESVKISEAETVQ